MAEPDHHSELIAAVVITDELLRRPPADPDYLREKQAMQDLAQQMADRPTEIIPRLVALAMEICDGVSAGVSVLDPETNRFRWLGVQGALAAMQGVTVPRENSPAGLLGYWRTGLVCSTGTRLRLDARWRSPSLRAVAGAAAE